jgi:hypothetical protein
MDSLQHSDRASACNREELCVNDRKVSNNGVMPDVLPDRLSVNPKSPHYNEELLKRSVGIRFNGVEKTNVEEYCVSEGWIRVAAGKGRDRHGNPLMITLRGTVEPFFKD